MDLGSGFGRRFSVAGLRHRGSLQNICCEWLNHSPDANPSMLKIHFWYTRTWGSFHMKGV